MNQLVDFPTQVKGNVLDLVITDNPELILNVSDEGRLGKSDHSLILIEIDQSTTVKNRGGEVKNWRRADWEAIRRGISGTVWPRTEDGVTTDQAWRLLKNKLEHLVEEHVPVVSMKPYDTPWMKRDIITEIRKKRKLWKKAKNGGDEDKHRYKEAEKKYET